ncbi:MAG: ElyC/SanA/YdcF family protein [Byssovorax sp.]
MLSSRGATLALLLALPGCFVHAEAPKQAPSGPAGGHAPPGIDAARACVDWRAAVAGDGAALEHDSFPELDPSQSCYVAVRYTASGPEADPPPPGCGYPRGAATFDAMTRAAARYERIAAGTSSEPLPIDLACALPDEARRAAASHNARTLRALARRLATHAPYPYAAISTFGFGHGAQSDSVLVPYRPGATCPVLGKRDMDLFGVNITRAGRAAEAYFAGVAPVVTVSGGSVHSTLVEAFLLEWLLSCRLGVPADAVLLDPCADHTHTNIRNTGALVREIGGRTAYLVTDDGLQSGYLEEWTSFDLMGGSLDQRSLRDFGHLLGSWRRASVGMSAGFWYTPYRFWAEPEAGLGSFTCVP